MPTRARYHTGTERGRSGRDSARKNRIQLAAARINTPRANKVTSDGLGLDLKDDLSHLMAGPQSLVGPPGLFQGKALVDHGMQAPADHQGHDLIEV